MIKTQAEISKSIRDQLRILDPEISLQPGTPERKIVDVVSQAIAEVNVDTFVQGYQYDIDTKYGSDLDDFVSLFGFSRQAAVRASGRIVFSRPTPTPAPIFIPAGTQVARPATSVTPQIVFQTLVDCIIPEGGTYVETPIEAIVAGSSGNVPANSITSFSFGNGAIVSGISSVYNPTGTQGGAEAESDEELTLRFKNTNLRNIAGTRDQLLAIAIAASMTTKANLIGAMSRFSEYLQIDNLGYASSQNPHSKYTYDYDYFLTANGTDSGEIYTPEVDYTFDIDPVYGTPYIFSYASIFPAPDNALTAAVTNNNGPLIGSYEWAYTYVLEHPDGPHSQFGIGETSLSPATSLTLSEQSSVLLTVPTGRVQELYANGTINGGNFTLTFDGQTTGSISWSANAATVLAALEALSNIAPGDIQISGTTALGGLFITFTEQFAETQIPTITVTNSVAGGGAYAIARQVIERRIYRKQGGEWYRVGVIPNDTDATFTDSTTILGPNPPKPGLNVGSIVYFDHAYLSANSRNIINELQNVYILNKIDIYINGESVVAARDVIPSPIIDGGDPNNTLFTNSTGSRYYVQNYKRVYGNTTPTVGNSFVKLIWTPVASLPSSITIGGNTYSLNQDYFLVKDISTLRGSKRARDGIEMSSTMAAAIQNSRFVVEYSFNRVPLVINQVIDEHRQIGQDILVHEANTRYFNVNLVLMYNKGANRGTVNNNVSNSLSSWFRSKNFGDVIQISDILNVVQNTQGVDNARIATVADSTSYGIQEVDSAGTVLSTFTTDFTLSDIDLASFNSLGPNGAPIERSQNTWVGGL